MSTATLISRALQERLDSARQLTDSIFALLKPEALYSRPIPERHRLVFYLGHLEAFDWNLICRKTLGVGSLSPQFDTLFEFGIDPPVGQAAQDQPSDWPTVEEIQAYNRRVRARIDELLDQVPEQIIHVALEHRLMHAETLAYLLHNLPYDQKSAGRRAPWIHAASRLANPMIEIAPGIATLGQKRGEFGWDNEFAEHRGKCSRLPRQQVQNYERPVSRFRARWRFRAALLDSARQFMVLSRDVFRSPAAAERPGVRHARRGRRLRALGRQAIAHRRAISSSRPTKHT